MYAAKHKYGFTWSKKFLNSWRSSNILKGFFFFLCSDWKERTVGNLKYSCWGSADVFLSVYCLIQFKVFPCELAHSSRVEGFLPLTTVISSLLSYPLVLVRRHKCTNSNFTEERMIWGIWWVPGAVSSTQETFCVEKAVLHLSSFMLTQRFNTRGSVGCLLQFIQVEDLHSSTTSALLFGLFFPVLQPWFRGKWHLNVRKKERIINGGINTEENTDSILNQNNLQKKSKMSEVQREETAFSACHW